LGAGTRLTTSDRMGILDDIIDGDERARTALIDLALPLPRLELNGEIIAFRQWQLHLDGQLRSTNHNLVWAELEFADEMPTNSNRHGLYATRIDPVGLSQGSLHGYLPIGSGVDSLNGVECCGLVALSGTVIEHEDGVYRAECARLLCIWLVSCSPYVYELVPKLYANYPTTPIYVCNTKQVVEALFMLAAMRLENYVERV
jgi:hypothetical protein